ncbi:hypothetical protein PGT21_002854 [Puccinia graminis f. sp. tritici]|uniref:Uncharacterized protein n=1 Tax=Puccinia graminis f. sp. tritici TaxID=56615 RepID=A0A5B0MT84_PUCGR|nr:hypothetical protein PGTUg99_014884 [Puccinia graminis f. sp. tritici]KAA1103857.1 hypothetical protein PGT21_002854 [Puccinia graminis f. sp. tritici]
MVQIQAGKSFTTGKTSVFSGYLLLTLSLIVIFSYLCESTVIPSKRGLTRRQGSQRQRASPKDKKAKKFDHHPICRNGQIPITDPKTGANKGCEDPHDHD